MLDITVWITSLVTLLCVAQNCSCWLFFPQNSAFGIIAAIAVPLDLPHRNVFLSYNFEANYNYPTQFDIPPILNGIEDEARHLVSECHNCTGLNSDEETTTPFAENFNENVTTSGTESTENIEDRKKRSVDSQPLISRLHIYHILEDRFARSGYAGQSCLLRMICETNASELGEVNGVLGTLLHILFSPTTSRKENIPIVYYQAEYDGKQDECQHYHEQCGKSLLELISTSYGKILEDIFTNEMNK